MKILFRGFESTGRAPGLGDIFDYCQACYLKGQDLGFHDIEIVFPRWGPYNHLGWGITPEEFQWQKTDFLPWKWIPRNEPIIEEEWDMVINTLESDSLYDGYSGINSGFWETSQYLSMMHKEKKISPCLDVKRNIDEKYILFQYRTKFAERTCHDEERVTSLSQFQSILDIVKKATKDKYNYWQIGNECSIENQFDKVIPLMYNDLDGLAKLICNSSLIIVSQSGIWNISSLIPDLPIIGTSFISILQSNVPSTWKSKMPNSNVEKHPNWCDDRTIFFQKDKNVDKEKIQNFVNKFSL